MGEIDKPFAEISIGGENCPVTRDNLAVYRHIGKNAMYDHCYVRKPDGSGGGYIWNDHPGFEKYVELAQEHEARIFLNIPEPSDLDIKYYIKNALFDLENTTTLPPEWLDE